MTPLHPARGERGIALVSALIIMSVLLSLGTFALMTSRSEIRTSANYRGRVQAQYFAEAGIDQVVGLQNDLTESPRYFFDAANYVSMSSDSSVFNDLPAVDPETGATIGTIHRLIVGSNPAAQPPPWRMRSTATMNDGSQATFEVDINALSLLDFAIYAEASLWYCPPGTTLGRTYSGGNITIVGGCSPPEVFMKKVEYVGSLSGASRGDFREGAFRIPAYPPLSTLADLSFFEDASKTPGFCSDGVGLFIGATDGGIPNAVRDQSEDLFGMRDTGKPGVDDLNDDDDWEDSEGEAVNGCKTTSGGPPQCYQIDLTLFDFASDPITYGGVPVIGWSGAVLRPSTFNGVVYVNGELHIWGILGGRSPEDAVTVDSITIYDALLTRPTAYPANNINPPTEPIGVLAVGEPFYHHPNFDELAVPWDTLTSNLYSNNVLDAGEDANGNGILDPAGKGRSLSIVTDANSDIVIDHNIHYGTDPNGNRVSLGLLAGDVVYIDPSSPRAIQVTGAKLGRGADSYGGWNGSFVALPNNDQLTHRPNYWAKARGDSNPADSTYVYDLNANGVVETNNGMGLAGDRDETAMRNAWAVVDLGNIVTAGGASYGAWATGLHGGTMIYDFDLLSAEPPCWPVLPYYGTVSGSFTEIRN
ncbi:MAG: PilX N-terminal domain-containing pilus assembly protein [Gemmatimonadota bacterium]